MGFRLVPKSLTLNYPERRKWRVMAIILRYFAYSVAFVANYIKVID